MIMINKLTWTTNENNIRTRKWYVRYLHNLKLEFQSSSANLQLTKQGFQKKLYGYIEYHSNSIPSFF